MLAVNVEVILIVIVCSKILFVKAVISNSPVAELKLIIGELETGNVPVESQRLYESTQFEEYVVDENYVAMNTFRGVVVDGNDVTYPQKYIRVPIIGVHVTTVDY